MRELKFRAWNRVTKRMWWFDLMWGNTDAAGSGWIGMLDSPDGNKHTPNGSDNRVQVDPDDCEIMQYTGLKDKDGKEIYEGDRVAFCRTLTREKVIVTIAFNEQIAAFVMRGLEMWDCTFLKDYKDSEFEVIGNIYEGLYIGYSNPELVKEA